MSEPSNEIAAPAQVGETAAESINWGDAPVAAAQPSEPAQPAQPAQEPAPAQPVIPAQPPAEPNPDFTFSTLENGERELRLATGQVYKGKDDAGILEQVTRAQLEASRTITQLRSQAPPPVAPPVVPASEVIDPAEEALADMTARGLGFKDGKELRAGIEALRQSSTQNQDIYLEIRNQQTAMQFLKETPDFVNTPANSQKLDEALVAMNLPFTAENAKWAHYALKGQGVYEAPVVVTEAHSVPRTATGQFAQRTNLMPMPPNASIPAPAAPTHPDPFAMTDAEFDVAFRERMSA